MTRAQLLAAALIAERKAQRVREQAAKYRASMPRTYLKHIEQAERHERHAAQFRARAESRIDHSIVALAPIAAALHPMSR